MLIVIESNPPGRGITDKKNEIYADNPGLYWKCHLRYIEEKAGGNATFTVAACCDQRRNRKLYRLGAFLLAD